MVFYCSKPILVELTTLRSRLSKLEATKAEVDLELKKTENQLESDAERFEAEIQNNQERQRQGLIFFYLNQSKSPF